ncbi:tetratricopeptide (TPR) repeat protein [Haloferula luteola]|uniref:Tetratricopeptide (TPR) repeat protein n=1 Tax=Haloferula luteola TaxID=595692 RepID=A0A840V6C5_9BACT|nr:hypothetical protein [Haloferula luteola]MBB5351174.1 tetratricopeptide (TPR) repeat protein [Haloferula luteola]
MESRTRTLIARWLFLTPWLLACGPFFYQAPPPLDAYFDRLPGKRWDQLTDEVLPPNTETSEILRTEALDRFQHLSANDTVAALETLAARNRNLSRMDILLANVLLEARELAPTHPPGAADYLISRLDPLKNSPLPPEPFQSWRETEEEFQARHRQWESDTSQRIRESGKAMGLAPPDLAPYLQIRHAVLLTELQRFEPAHLLYQGIISSNPNHPRAEVARFMLGRLGITEARLLKNDPERRNQALTHARDHLTTYLADYPQGRFVGDVHGWLGAVELAEGKTREAIHQQLLRLSLQPTREATLSVLRECDQLFADLISEAAENDLTSEFRYYLDEPDFQQIAAHPLVTRLLLYHCLDPAYQVILPLPYDNTSGDRRTLRFLSNKIIRATPYTTHLLAHLASAVTSQPQAATDPTSLLILGWSALREEQTPQALVLFDRALKAGPTDELLHARAVTLDRLGRYAEAADAFAQLEIQAPESPLTGPSQFDHAIALFRAQRSGEALLRLWEIEGHFSPDTRPVPFLPENVISQWVDSIAQFAPLDELEDPLQQLSADHPATTELRRIIRLRALADEDFERARRHLDPPLPAVEPISRWTNRWRADDFIPMDETRWAQEITPLAELTAQASSPADHLELARRWVAARGRVTLPLNEWIDYSNSEGPKLDLLRRRNGRVLNLPDTTVVAHLDKLDELTHALRHFLLAAPSSDPDIAAPALEEANETLRALSEFSLYRGSRAVETDADALSADLVDQLHTRFPHRPEALRALPQVFLPPLTLSDWMPGDYNRANSALALNATLTSLHSSDSASDSDLKAETATRLHNAIRALARRPLKLFQIRDQLDHLANEFVVARPHLFPEDINTIGDHIRDLTVAAHLPGVDPDSFHIYAESRITSSPPPDLPEIFAPMVEFNQLAVQTNTTTNWQAYLDTFPSSPKADAVRLRILRKQVRDYAPVPSIEPFQFPDAPIPGGYKRAVMPPSQTGTEPSSLLAAIELYQKDFPDTPYLADLSLLKAAVQLRQGQVDSSLPVLARIINDPSHAELRTEAGLYFAWIAQDLLEADRRQPIVTALRQHPQALKIVTQLALGDTFLFRLRPLLPALQAP